LRRQGWGRRLTELTIDYARSRGRGRMILWSDTRFTKAHQLYRGMGFRETGVRELHDSNNTVEYGFEKELD
jgi:GNAT superfamily N-acetyltransferase